MKYTFFHKQLCFLLQPWVAYGRMNFQPDSCLAVTYSAWKVSKYGVFSGPYFPACIRIRKNSVFGHFSRSVTQSIFSFWFLSSCLFMLSSYGVIGDRLYVFSPFLSRFVVFQKTCRISKKLFFMISATWSVSFKSFYFFIWAWAPSVKYSSPKRVVC